MAYESGGGAQVDGIERATPYSSAIWSFIYTKAMQGEPTELAELRLLLSVENLVGKRKDGEREVKMGGVQQCVPTKERGTLKNKAKQHRSPKESSRYVPGDCTRHKDTG